MYYQFISKDKAKKLLEYKECKVYKISGFNEKPIEISKYSYSLSFFNVRFCIEIPKTALEFRIRLFKTAAYSAIINNPTDSLEFLLKTFKDKNTIHEITGFNDKNYKMSVDEDLEKEVFKIASNWLDSSEFEGLANDLRASL